MTKRIMNFLMIVLLILSVNAVNSFAIGLGVYISYGNGGTKYDFSRFQRDLTGSQTNYGIGAVLDTKVAKEGLVNYRLNLAYEVAFYTFKNGNMIDGIKNENLNSIDFFRATIDNTLGFAVVQDEDIRVWVGPTLRLVDQMGITESRSDFENSSEFSDMIAFGAGFGGVIGINWHLSKLISLSGEGGFRQVEYWGVESYGDEWTNSDGELFFKISMLFKIKDVFVK